MNIHVVTFLNAAVFFSHVRIDFEFRILHFVFAYWGKSRLEKYGSRDDLAEISRVRKFWKGLVLVVIMVLAK